MNRAEYGAEGQTEYDTNDGGFSWGPILRLDLVVCIKNGSTHLFSSSYPAVEIQIRPQEKAERPPPFRSLENCHHLLI